MNTTTTWRMGARRLLRSVKHGPDRLLHPLRRWRVTRQVRRMGITRNVLVMCHGNICRSPFAEHSLRVHARLAGRNDLVAYSAGFIGPGRGSPSGAVRAAERFSIDLRRHQSQVVTREMIGGADLIIVMNARQRTDLSRMVPASRGATILLGDLDPLPIDTRAIRDPEGQPDAVFDEVYERLDRCLEVLSRAFSPLSGTDVTPQE